MYVITYFNIQTVINNRNINYTLNTFTQINVSTPTCADAAKSATSINQPCCTHCIVPNL